MSTSILPGIAELDPESLSYAIYTQLYQHFFNAQDAGTVVEGDATSIRLRNAAYGFAEAIACGVAGEGGATEGGVLAGYLRRSGGQMSGPLGADYGFTAGIENRRLLELYGVDSEGNDAGVRILGDLMVEGSRILIGGQPFIRYQGSGERIYITYPEIDFGDSRVQMPGGLLIGEDMDTGVFLSPESIQVAGCGVYHQGNANRSSIDWSMRRAEVADDLIVSGKATFLGSMTAMHGVSLGAGGKQMMGLTDEFIVARASLAFTEGFGIRFDDHAVLARVNKRDIMFSGCGGDLLLGGDETRKIKILSGILDADGQYEMLSAHGSAYFPESLVVRHNFGDMLLSTYREHSGDEGVVIHKRLRFASAEGPYLYGEDTGIGFSAQVDRPAEDGAIESLHYHTAIRYDASTSLHRPADRPSDTLAIVSSADFIRFENPVEACGHIGIDNSFTRLTDGRLFLSQGSYLLSADGGIRHFGNAYFQEDISSELFSSGFAGSGWAILRNRTTGHRAATFDELTVRKKMRIYELEVQQSRATNGSLWISDSCSGDTVEPIQ